MLRGVKHYFRPTTVEEAVKLVRSTPYAVYLGGGAWTVAQGDPTLEAVVDLQALGLDVVAEEADRFIIGAMVTLQGLIDWPALHAFAHGLLPLAAEFTQSRNLREQGTVGGTLMVAGPADPLTTVLLVLDVELHYADPAPQVMAFADFVAQRQALAESKALLTQLVVRRPRLRCGAAFEVVGRSPKDRPIVCAAAYVLAEDGKAMDVRVAVGGADATPVRLEAVEKALSGAPITEAGVVEALRGALPNLHPYDDFRGSAEYRLAMSEVLARRALLTAWERLA